MNYMNETGLKKLITLIKTALKGKADVSHEHAGYVKYANATAIEATTIVNADTLGVMPHHILCLFLVAQ